MKIVIVGAGAIGGYFGGRLAEAGLDVTFLVREKRAKQLKSTGLVIKSSLGDLTIIQPKLAVDIHEIEECDLVLLGVKNYQLAGTFPQLGYLVRLGAKILPLLNGVEHFDILAKEFGPENILGGLCRIVSTLDEEGTILQSGQLQEIVFGALHPAQEHFCNRVNQALTKANFKVKLSNDIMMDIWVKYGFITAFSGITTAGRLSTDEINKLEPTKEIYAKALREMLNLARASGVKMPGEFVEKNVEGLRYLAKGSTSSMNQDLRKGLPLEVESLQGAAIRIASRFDVEVPTIRTFYGLIKPYEEGLNS